MKYICLLIFTIIFSHCYGEDNNYSITGIPVELLLNTNSVVRTFDKEIIVHSKAKKTEKIKYAITILNDAADEHSNLVVDYDKSSSLKIHSIKIYDKNGKIIKKVKQREIQDISMNPGFVLFGDNRIKAYQYMSNIYPYTIEYEFEKEYKSILAYTIWMPVKSYFQSLQSAKLSLSIPNSLNANLKELNMPNKAEICNNEDRKTYSWTISNFRAIKKEDFSPSFNKIAPCLMVTPSKFEYEGYTGDLTSWETFGKWSYTLIQNRDILPEATIKEVKELTANLNTPKEKISTVYKYMQNKTRYVAIMLGIGGFQPFSAETVDKYCYGDCKALSNYTKSLLKAIGINSYYTVIGAGDSNKILYPDFAGGNQGNHIILCVPQPKDTIWLECTSQRSPFNYLGSFTSDRYAMLVTENGGKLVKTQCYNYKQNLKASNTNAKLLKNGSIELNIESKYHGLLGDNVLEYFHYSEKEKKEHLLKSLHIRGQKINSYDFKILNEGKNLCTQKNLDIFVADYVSTKGQRVFLPLNLINTTYYNPTKYSNRKQKIVQDECFTINDTIRWTIPEEYKVENLPRTRDLSTKYGEYHSSIKVDNNKIRYIRSLSFFKGIFPPEEYPEFYKFHKKVRKSEKAQIVLIKKS